MTSPRISAQLLQTGPELKHFKLVRVVLALVLAGLFAAFVLLSIRWPWMNDSGVMHYIVFLLKHGLAPYRQIVDINLPGSYLSEFIGITVFGSSDLGWRMYDYSLLLILIVAASYIASRYDWFAGLFAGVLFALIHGSEGPFQTAQRDEVMAVLAVAGYAFVFAGVRRKKAFWFLPAGVAFGFAGIIKPTIFAVEAMLTAFAWNEFRKQGRPAAPLLLQITLGTGSMLLGTSLFLLSRNSLHAFFDRVLNITSFYSTLVRPSSGYMLHYSTPRGLLLLLPIAAILFFWNRSWLNWELLALVGGALFGFASYWVQHKGFTYHRYPYVAFSLVWMGLEFVIALRAFGLRRWCGALGLLIGSLLVAPFYVSRIRASEQSNQVTATLIQDLARFPQSTLQGKVQCLDGVDGCYGALYRRQLMQSTGTMGDQLLFTTVPSAVADRLRNELLKELEASPPQLFILTNYWYGEPQSFKKLDAWPEFAQYLRSHYMLEQERVFSVPGQAKDPVAYQIYERR